MQSSARHSIWARDAAASTWDPAPYASQDSDARLTALGYNVSDLGNIDVEQAESLADPGPANAKYVTQIAESCEKLARIVEDSLIGRHIPVVLGGDHSIAAGTVAGVADYLRHSSQKTGLLWIDAHADMNTPATSPSGNVHGMPLACCIGQGPAELANLLGFAPKVDAAQRSAGRHP